METSLWLSPSHVLDLVLHFDNIYTNQQYGNKKLQDEQNRKPKLTAHKSISDNKWKNKRERKRERYRVLILKVQPVFERRSVNDRILRRWKIFISAYFCIEQHRKFEDNHRCDYSKKTDRWFNYDTRGQFNYDIILWQYILSLCIF